jgi:hypothetical protein
MQTPIGVAAVSSVSGSRAVQRGRKLRRIQAATIRRGTTLRAIRGRVRQGTPSRVLPAIRDRAPRVTVRREAIAHQVIALRDHLAEAAVEVHRTVRAAAVAGATRRAAAPVTGTDKAFFPATRQFLPKGPIPFSGGWALFLPWTLFYKVDIIFVIGSQRKRRRRPERKLRRRRGLVNYT